MLRAHEKDAGVTAQKFSLRARLRSFVYAARGVRTVIASQHNARLHALATACVVAGGLWFHVDDLEWALLILATVSVWTAESLNTAFEFLCDVASPEFHPLVEKAKDVAAGAVLICAIGAAAVGAIVFTPHVCDTLAALDVAARQPSSRHR